MGEENLTVSDRGQITLPSRLRKALGIRGGDVLTLAEEDGKLILKPRLLVDIDWYDDETIANWNREDELSDTDRQQLDAKLASK